MGKILRLGKTPSDNQTGSSGGAAVTKNISGEYSPFNAPNASLTIGTAGSGNNLFLWGTNSSEDNVEQEIADLASALGVTTANLVGVSITSPNLPAGATGFNSTADAVFSCLFILRVHGVIALMLLWAPACLRTKVSVVMLVASGRTLRTGYSLSKVN